MCSDRLVVCDCGFNLSALWYPLSVPSLWLSVEKLFGNISNMIASIIARWGTFPNRWKWKNDIWLSGSLSHMGGESREGAKRGGVLPSFLPPVRMGSGPSDWAVLESKGCDAGVVREETIAEILTEKNSGGEFGNVKTGIYFLPCDVSSLGFF